MAYILMPIRQHAQASKQQWEGYRSMTHCYICEKPFTDEMRIRDHYHLTGRYRGPAHSNCNLNYKNLLYIPIIFRNLSSYDTHFIIKEIVIAYETCRCTIEGKIHFIH